MSTPTEGAPKGPLSRPAPARGPGGGVLAQRKRPARTASGGAGGGNAQAMQRAQPGALPRRRETGRRRAARL